MHNENAEARWQELDAKRRGLITRSEKYAAFTIRKVCLPDGYDENSTELQHDYQSVGAQAVNHLTNKMMLTMFAPSRPAMRLDVSPETAKALTEQGLSPADLADSLAAAEKEAWAGIDREKGLRPKLYEILKHLIIVGNVLKDTSGDTVRALGLKSYVVRRSQSGRWVELILRDCLLFDELEEEVQAQFPHKKPDDEVKHYRWIVWRNGQYHMTQWVDRQILPRKFMASWKEDAVPFAPLCWDLAEGNDYGTGLVEDYQGDFAALSMMSEATIKAAILASEFRWLVNPGAQLKAEDLMNSENGAALPGSEGDVKPLSTGTGAMIQPMMALGSEYINRIGRGFLLASAVTRDAERVTAEEIRMQATELETSLGGAYSRIAVDLQTPLAYYLLRKVGFAIKGKAIRPTIITGLDALSRTGDLDNLRAFLGDIAQVTNLPPQTLQYLKLPRILRALAAGRNLPAADYVELNAQPMGGVPAEGQPPGPGASPEGEPTQ